MIYFKSTQNKDYIETLFLNVKYSLRPIPIARIKVPKVRIIKLRIVYIFWELYVCKKIFCQSQTEMDILSCDESKSQLIQNCLVCTVDFIAGELFSKFKFERYFWVSHLSVNCHSIVVSGVHLLSKGNEWNRVEVWKLCKVFFGMPFNKSKCLFIQSFVEQNLITILCSVSQQNVAMLLSNGSTNDKPF